MSLGRAGVGLAIGSFCRPAWRSLNLPVACLGQRVPLGGPWHLAWPSTYRRDLGIRFVRPFWFPHKQAKEGLRQPWESKLGGPQRGEPQGLLDAKKKVFCLALAPSPP